MTEKQKTLAAAAFLAAAVGVYLELNYQEKLRTDARRRARQPVPSASVAPSVPPGSPRPHGEPPK